MSTYEKCFFYDRGCFALPYVVNSPSHSLIYYRSSHHDSTSQCLFRRSKLVRRNKKRKRAVGYKFFNAVNNVLAGTAAATIALSLVGTSASAQGHFGLIKGRKMNMLPQSGSIQMDVNTELWMMASRAPCLRTPTARVFLAVVAAMFVT